MRTEALPTAVDVLAAARRLHGQIRRTPLEHSASLSAAAGTEVWLKLENQQRTGSFKLRGAVNAYALLPPGERAGGVVTASAGNHGQGVALAARLHGARAAVFVPEGAPETKRRRIAGYGADLHPVAGGYDDAHAAAERFAGERGIRYLHAFSDPDVVAGAGTTGLEILEELPATRTLLVPLGGGGLIGGIGVFVRALAPRVRLIGVQSRATAAMHASLAAGWLVSPPLEPTLCDGLAGDVNERSLRLARDVVDQVVLVEEDAVRQAIRRLYIEEGLVAEGSAAVVAAAIWSGALAAVVGPVVAVLTGGTLDAATLGSILLDGS